MKAQIYSVFRFSDRGTVEICEEISIPEIGLAFHTDGRLLSSPSRDGDRASSARWIDVDSETCRDLEESFSLKSKAVQNLSDWLGPPTVELLEDRIEEDMENASDDDEREKLQSLLKRVREFKRSEDRLLDLMHRLNERENEMLGCIQGLREREQELEELKSIQSDFIETLKRREKELDEVIENANKRLSAN